MKKVLLLALPVLAAAVLIPTAIAGKSANKATADLMFTNASGPAHWVFNAHDLGTTGDKGSVVYTDADGTYAANVIDAVVENGKATFTAMVTSSTISYAHQGDTFTWTVYDEGEGSKATEADYFTFNSAMLGGWEHPGTDELGTQYPVTAGNIQIHFSS